MFISSLPVKVGRFQLVQTREGCIHVEVLVDNQTSSRAGEVHSLVTQMEEPYLIRDSGSIPV